MLRLIVKREGSLLSQEINREITQDQLEKVQAILLAEDLGDTAEVVIHENGPQLEGIEQYQAEGR